MVIRNVPHEYFGPATARAESPVVGHLSGKPVFATVVDRHGRRYRFVGLATWDGRGRIDVLSAGRVDRCA
jgi:hypothetical protein